MITTEATDWGVMDPMTGWVGHAVSHRHAEELVAPLGIREGWLVVSRTVTITYGDWSIALMRSGGAT